MVTNSYVRGRTLVVTAAVLLISIFCSPAAAQVNTASIRGTVTDSSGAVVPGVAVDATNHATGVSYRPLRTAKASIRFRY